MLYERVGTLIYVGEVQEFKNNFRKRIIAVEVEGQEYGRTLGFSLAKDNADLVSTGDLDKKVLVKFVIEGREHEGRFFNDLVCKNLSFVAGESTPKAEQPKAAAKGKVDATLPSTNQPIREVVDNEDDSSDLPF